MARVSDPMNPEDHKCGKCGRADLNTWARREGDYWECLQCHTSYAVGGQSAYWADEPHNYRTTYMWFTDADAMANAAEDERNEQVNPYIVVDGATACGIAFYAGMLEVRAARVSASLRASVAAVKKPSRDWDEYKGY